MIRYLFILLLSFYILIFIDNTWIIWLFLISLFIIRLTSWRNEKGSYRVIIIDKVSSLFYSKKFTKSANILYSLAFVFVISINISGLFCYNQHILLSAIAVTLSILAMTLWLFSYRAYIHSGWIYFSSRVIVNIGYPALSILLRNIEILTH